MAFSSKPRIGVPYRTKREQLSGHRAKIGRYLKAVHLAGGEPIDVPLDLPFSNLLALAASLDGVVLSGSPADIDPTLFAAPRHPKCAAPDRDRERTDFALIEHCLSEQKPLLAICYGIQSLNVFLGGTLIQDIPSELHSDVEHDVESDHGCPETFHTVQIDPSSRLSDLAMNVPEVRVNSSHHQSVLAAGRNLKVTARSIDGAIEALEWNPQSHTKLEEDGPWVVAVQWHPERMIESDPFALSLFRSLTGAARKAPVRA